LLLICEVRIQWKSIVYGGGPFELLSEVYLY
jgi:hypothetical protein